MVADPLDVVLQLLAHAPLADDGGDLPRPVGQPPDDVAVHAQLRLLLELIRRQPRTHRLVLQGVPPVVCSSEAGEREQHLGVVWGDLLHRGVVPHAALVLALHLQAQSRAPAAYGGAGEHGSQRGENPVGDVSATLRLTGWVLSSAVEKAA